METALMAKPKAKAKRRKQEESGPKPTALTIKGSLEWRAWVERVADHCRVSSSTLVDLAITEYAKNRGFNEQPPTR